MARPRVFDTNEAIDAALDAFLEGGYEATSLSELLDAMGIGQGSFYNAFRGKRDVYLRALGRWRERSRAEEPTALLRGPGVGISRIEAFFDGLVERASKRGVPQVCLFLTAAVENIGGDRALSRATANGLLGIRELLAEALREARDAGEIRRGLQPTRLASLLLSLAYGVQVMARARVPLPVLRESLQAMLGLLRAPKSR